jgi:hypothetical protein
MKDLKKYLVFLHNNAGTHVGSWNNFTRVIYAKNKKEALSNCFQLDKVGKAEIEKDILHYIEKQGNFNATFIQKLQSAIRNYGDVLMFKGDFYLKLKQELYNNSTPATEAYGDVYVIELKEDKSYAILMNKIQEEVFNAVVSIKEKNKSIIDLQSQVEYNKFLEIKKEYLRLLPKFENLL